MKTGTLVTQTSPSPRPSLSGRGRIISRLSEEPAAGLTLNGLEESANVASFSLSPRERARVRGNAALILTALIYLATAFLGLAPLQAADATAEFDQANKFYEAGKFRDAADAYGKIISTGTSSTALLFNLGNAQFKAGNVGHAIAAYRQAAQLSPRNADLNANLQFARTRVTGPTLKLNWLHRAIASLTTNEWTLLAVLPVWLWFALLIARQIKPALKPSLRTATFLSGTAALLACAALTFVLHHRFNEPTVVVTARDAVARFGPFTESQSAFTATDGAELRLLDAKDDWFQVTAGGKTFGWLKTNAVVLLN